MSDLDIEAENKQLLKGTWDRLRSGVDASRLGMSRDAADVLVKMDEFQVYRAATAHTPLFHFGCTAEMLQGAMVANGFNFGRDDDAQVFLINRWRAVENSFVTAQQIYGLSRPFYDTLKAATLQGILAAAASGMRLYRFSVRPQYLFHSGSRLDFHTGQRTKLALCSTSRMGI